MDPYSVYDEGRSRLHLQWVTLETRSKRLALLRVVLVASALGTIFAIAWTGLGARGWWLFAALSLLFLWVMRLHSAVLSAQDRALSARTFHERGIARLDGKWMRTSSGGERFRSAAHPYTDDLDIFGPASLFEHIDCTSTRFGEERLASLLSGEGVGAFPDDVRARGVAVRELAEKGAFREQLFASGALLSDKKLDPTGLIAWAGASASSPVPGALRFGLYGLAVVACSIVGLHFAIGLHPVFAGGAFLVELFVGRLLLERVRNALTNVSSSATTLARYGELVALIERETWASPLLLAEQKRLSQTGRTASSEIAKLATIVSFVDARENGLFRIFIGPWLMWDEQCAIALDAWRARAGADVRVWFEAIGELEALSSLAAFAFDRPDHTWPALETEPRLSAEGLGHPLIASASRVGNDVSLSREAPVIVITGSNMSGKSTLLRSIGINVVLALAGTKVTAKSMSVGRYRIATSMRIRDSLEQNVSHFYAELRRLKVVIDMTQTHEGEVLFLLDEILHGTNSRERVLGARSVVKKLVAAGAQGAVSTHDVGITDLEAELGGRVRNVHFQEQVESEQMTFDYKLKSGVVQTSNALRLMQQVGIDVTDVFLETTKG